MITNIKNKDMHTKLDSYLKHAGLKLTRQRSLILDAFLCTDSHISADEMYRKMQDIDPNIGLATVFRTMRHLKESGIAQELVLDGKTIRYELIAPSGHHDHAQCIRCHDVFEFHSTEIETLQQKICTELKVDLVSHQMILFVLCSNCKKKEEQ
jgi:Fur family ferric uptake transcriptional regulator